MAKQAHSKPRHVTMCLITSLQRVVEVPLSSHFHADYRGTRDSTTVGAFAQPTGVITLKRLLKTGEKMVKARSFEVLQAQNKVPICHGLKVFAQRTGSTRICRFAAPAQNCK